MPQRRRRHNHETACAMYRFWCTSAFHSTGRPGEDVGVASFAFAATLKTASGRAQRRESGTPDHRDGPTSIAARDRHGWRRSPARLMNIPNIPGGDYDWSLAEGRTGLPRSRGARCSVMAARPARTGDRVSQSVRPCSCRHSALQKAAGACPPAILVSSLSAPTDTATEPEYEVADRCRQARAFPSTSSCSATNYGLQQPDDFTISSRGRTRRCSTLVSIFCTSETTITDHRTTSSSLDNSGIPHTAANVLSRPQPLSRPATCVERRGPQGGEGGMEDLLLPSSAVLGRPDPWLGSRSPGATRAAIRQIRRRRRVLGARPHL